MFVENLTEEFVDCTVMILMALLLIRDIILIYKTSWYSSNGI